MIHSFKLLGKFIVVDVNSGAVHDVDEICYDVIDVINNLNSYTDYKSIIEALNDKQSGKYDLKDVNTIRTIEESITEVKELIEQGQLFTEDAYMNNIPVHGKHTQVKALCLHISHNCNLKCKYCFAREGTFGGDRLNMTPQVGKAAIDFVVAASQKRKNIEIDFFGGEPLLNFDTVKEIIDYALSLEEENNKHFNFTLTTNGILLDDEKLEYINKNIDNIVLSIDGRRETNDKMRKKYDGTGCYDTILPKFIKTAESRNQDRYYVRGTYTAENLDFSQDVLHLADKGFRQISVEPVVASDGCGYELKQEHLEKLYSEYENLAQEYIKRFDTDKWFNFFHFMVDLEQGPCVYKRLAGCGAGHEYVAVTPTGDIFPCHQFADKEELKLGNVYDGVLKNDISDTFKNSNIYTKSDCTDCWAKFYCSGGCPANAYNFNADINKPYKIACDLEKKRVECALWIAATRS